MGTGAAFYSKPCQLQSVMRHLCLLSLFAVFNFHFAIAQSPPVACPGSFPSPAPFCSDACIVCDLDGYVGTNEWFFQWEAPPQFCAPQFHSINWLGFVAGSSSLTLEITAQACQTGMGLQAGIYTSTGCTSFTQVSNCDPGFLATTLVATGLTPGTVCYLVVDGNGGDICDFTVDVISGSTLPPAVDGTPTIDGTASFCPGAQAWFSAGGVSGAGYYQWELNGIPIGLEQHVMLDDLPAGSYELCVTPGNPCYGPGETTCTTFSVAPPPPEFINEEVCMEDLPYNYQGYAFFSTGIYSFEVLRPDGCLQPIILNLTVLGPNPPTVVTGEICAGGFYDFAGQLLTQPGVYQFPLTDRNGCDSTVSLVLTVRPPSLTNLGTVAAGLPFLVGNVPIDTTGDFVVVLINQYGCDSIVAGFLAALAPDTLFIDSTICQGDTVFYNMVALTSSGTYLDTIINGGTATIQQLNLTVLPVSNSTVNASICQGEEFVVGSTVYNSTGQYVETLSAANGCDSVVTLNLSVLQPADTIQAAICEGESYILGNQAYTQPGVYDAVLTLPTGCQSMVQLQLTVYPLAVTLLTEVICEGESVTIGGNTYSASGAYTNILTAANGCDSIVNLGLTVLPIPNDTLSASICEGGVYSWGGVDYSQGGVFCDTIPGGSPAGCDNITCLDLTVLPNDTLFVDTAICDGETIAIGNSVYSAPGQYLDVLVAANGCDSLIFLNLSVLPAAETFIDVQICQGETYNIGGQVLTNTGVYPVVFPDPQTGCDSIVTVTLAVQPASFTQLDATICEGETFLFAGTELSLAGQYTEVFVSGAGCDSVVALALAVIPAVETQLDTTLCPGQALHLGPYVFREPFEGTLQFAGAGGCDSILSLALAYYDTIRIDSFFIEPDDQDFFGGSIYVELGGGTPPYSYLWSDGRTAPFIDFLPTGQYFLMAADAHCSRGFLFKVPLRDEFSAGPVTFRPGAGGGSIVVSPNPFRKGLQVRLSGIREDLPVRLRLYNLAGQPVYEGQVQGFVHQLQPQVPAGVFWLVAEQGGERIGVEKVICVTK